jgi:serine/threonine protein kinase
VAVVETESAGSMLPRGASMTALLEQHLGRYEIEAQVGAGGFGDVYRAFDPLLRRRVALKLMRPGGSGADVPLLLSSCLREARAASALNHPGIVTIHDMGEFESHPFIVMEWIEGGTLRSMLRDHTTVSPAEAGEIGSQVAAALARAHDAGIVHRDLKPENVMRRSDGVVKLLDFGLAMENPSQPELSSEAEGAAPHEETNAAPASTTASTLPMRSGWVAGTLGYIAPEIMRGQPPSPSSDLFALGVVLYEMLTGRHPFGGRTPRETQQRILTSDPLPMELPLTLPPGWQELIMQLMESDPENRPPSATEALHVLMGRLSLDATGIHRPGEPAFSRDAGARASLMPDRDQLLKSMSVRRTTPTRWSDACRVCGSATLEGARVCGDEIERGSAPGSTTEWPPAPTGWGRGPRSDSGDAFRLA